VTAFDSDIVSLLFSGSKPYVDRAGAIPAKELALPIGVVEEMLRGRLNTIRQAESSRGTALLPGAYELFRRTVELLRPYRLLPYDGNADSLVAGWKKSRIKVGTHDMRIAASCIASNVTLVSRNRRDFDRLPGLRVEYWDEATGGAGDANGVGEPNS